VELLLVVAIGSLLAVLTAPTLVGFAQTSALQAGARELATAINLGRQIAIADNTSVCVEATGPGIRFRRGGCGGEIWTGPGTNEHGVVRLSDPSALRIAATASVVFTNLGAASPAGTYTVTHPMTNRMRTVVVAASGRVSVR
jgi:Tfp pilus assembly protein FimT